MNTDTGRITHFLNDEDLAKAQKKFGSALVEIDEADITKRQKETQRVLIHDTRSRLGIRRRKEIKKIGRNSPCPCGSGLKYKRCCLW